MGLLDQVFRDLKSTLTDVFVDEEQTILRKAVAYNKLTGIEETVEEEYPLKMSKPEYFHERDINGTTIHQGDFKISIAALDADALEYVPDKATDILVYNDIQYQIINVTTTGGELPVSYILHCRR